MRAKVWVETEVEVEVGVSDMIAALCDLPEPEKLGLALSGLSSCLGYIKKLPDAIVAELNDKQREIIVSTLEAQAARYKTPNAKSAATVGSPLDCRVIRLEPRRKNDPLPRLADNTRDSSLRSRERRACLCVVPIRRPVEPSD